MTETQESKAPPPRIGWKMGVAGLAAIAFVGWSMTNTDADEFRPANDGIPRHEAWGACQDAVKEHLRNPSTADFRVLTTKDTRSADGGYDFSGSLTAQNSYGVEEDLIYSCDVTPEGFVTEEVRTAD